MTTEAGKALLADLTGDGDLSNTVVLSAYQQGLANDIAAIEAEARQQERERLLEHELLIDFGYEEFGCSCGWDSDLSEPAQRWVDHLLADPEPAP